MDNPDTADKPCVPESLPIKSLAPTNDDYVDGCFSFDFTHCEDHRIWSKIDALKKIPGLVKNNRLEEAWSILDANEDAFYDFDFIYVWKALIFQKNGQLDGAKKILASGLKHARQKFILCDRLGLLEYETGDFNGAVNWWIKSIVAMVSINSVTMWEPFIYLAYVARACGSETHFKILMAQVTQISVRGELNLEETAVKTLYKKASSLSVNPVLKAIECLCDNFITPLNPEKTEPGVEHALAASLSAENNHDTWMINKKRLWMIPLAATGLILVCLFIFFFFFKTPPLPPLTPDLSEIREGNGLNMGNPIPEKKADLEKADMVPVNDTKKKLPSPEKPPQIKHKKKPSHLKVKTKSPRPVIKKKAASPE